MFSNKTRDRWLILVDEATFQATPVGRRRLFEQHQYRLPMVQLDDSSTLPARITARIPPEEPIGVRLIALDPTADTEMISMLANTNYATAATARKTTEPPTKRKQRSDSARQSTSSDPPQPAVQANDEEPHESQPTWLQKLKQLRATATRLPRKEKTNPEAVPTLSKLMTRIMKVGDAITRETERLNAGIPSSIITPPPVRVPETKLFSENWYAKTHRLLMATSMEMAAYNIEELTRIKLELDEEYSIKESEYNPTEADCEQIFKNVKKLTEGNAPGRPTPTGVNLPLEFYLHPEGSTTFIVQNPELHTYYNTTGQRLPRQRSPEQQPPTAKSKGSSNQRPSTGQNPAHKQKTGTQHRPERRDTSKDRPQQSKNRNGFHDPDRGGQQEPRRAQNPSRDSYRPRRK